MSELLLRVARCENIADARTSAAHACHRIVASQRATEESFQVPEAWNGHLESAPLLFLSSNPSIGDGCQYPRGSWSNPDIEDFFINRFGGGIKRWTIGGNKALPDDGRHASANQFWSSIRKRAMELFEREVVPGRDYALTEVVRCKSRDEEGVPEAEHECSGRYLPATIEASGASVIVALGVVAERHLRKLASFNGPVSPIVMIGMRERVVAILPHPGAWRVRKKFAYCVSEVDLARLRERLRS